MSWEQQQESERRQWDEERGWWLALDSDPKYLLWLLAESQRITAEVNGQLNLIEQE